MRRRNVARHAPSNWCDADVTDPGLLTDLDGTVDLLVAQSAVHS